MVSLLIFISLLCMYTIGYGQDPITFNPQRGFYDNPFQLTLTSSISGAAIRYTTDGSEPSPTLGIIYSGPISINNTSNIRAIAYNGSTSSRIITHSFVFLNSVIHQPSTISGWPNNTYNLGSGTTTAVHDYEMDPDIVNSPAYSTQMIAAMKAIPTMCIVMDKNKFWQSYDASTDADIENPTSIEVLYPNTPASNEQVNGGIEGHSHKRLKRSLRLKFKSSYGFSNFSTQLFKKGPVNGPTALSHTDNIVLRSGNNRCWARNWNPDRTCYTRDEWYRQSQIEISGYGSHGNFVHLYVNGLYWGLYNPVERPDDNFEADYFGGSDSDWFAFNHDGNKDGDSTRWHYLKTTLVSKDMTVAANYQEMKQYLDVENLCDYLIVSWMTGMTDWPANNFWGGNRNSPAGPSKFFTWDCEWSWDVTNNSNEGAWVHPLFRTSQSGGPILTSLWHALRRNPDFMAVFADRVQKHCFNNGPLTDQNSRNRWSTINNHINLAIIAESARWGDALNDGITRTKNDHWQPEITRVDGLMNGNVTRFITALRAQGYYPALDAAAFNSSGGNVNSGFQLIITNPNANGSIYYTTNGDDPRDTGGNNSASAILYSGPITLSSSKTIKARIKNGTSWSALTSAAFTIQSSQITGLFINEFLASNSLTNVDEFGDKDDWIEIYNSNNTPVDLGGLYITDKLTNKTLWRFPTTDPSVTTIPAKGYKLLWADEEPGEGVLHVNLKLSNGGEQIGLFQIVGTDTITIDQYTFGAQTADISTGRFPEGSANFITFSKPTPGAKNTVSAVSNIYINEFLASNSTGIQDDFGDKEDWIEIYNNNDTPVNIGGFYITDNLSNQGLYQIPTTNPALTTIPAKGYLVLWADNEPAEGVLHINIKLSNSGEAIGLFQKFGTEYSVVDSLTFGAQSADISMGRYPDGSKNFVFFNTPTPNVTNSIPLKTGLYINEFLASNSANIKDEYNENDDWIEIYNSNNFPVDIGGLFITDKLNTPAMYQIPTNNPALTTIAANSFLLLWADKQMTQGVRHVDIKLGAEGEQIGLVQKNGTTITYLDSLTFGAQNDNISEGRYPNGSSDRTKFNVPTPAASNVVNSAPIANAGLSRTITLPKDTIIQPGTAFDPDVDAITIRWTKDSGPACTITDSSHIPMKVSGLVAGIYIFRLTVTDSKGISASDTMKVTVHPAAGISVVSLTLINAETDTDIRTLKLQDTINFGALPTNKINIRANTSPAAVGSVVFTLNSSVIKESSAPYSLKGDINGDYNQWTPSLGTYTLNAKPYTLAGGTGAAGQDLSISFIVINVAVNKAPIVDAGNAIPLTLPEDSASITGNATDPDGDPLSLKWTKVSGPSCTITDSIHVTLKVKNLTIGSYLFRLTANDNKGGIASDTVSVIVSPPAGNTLISFTLINAETDTDIRTLKIQDTVNLAMLPTNKINIRANTFPATVGSVVFNLNGSPVTESTAPYSLKGDNNGNYNNWTPTLGTYTLSGTPYTLSGGKGTAGNPLSITFVVINNLTNKLPIANAGSDISINLPLDSVIISGSGSDPDGTIVSYLWTKEEGGTATLSQTTTPTLKVKGLALGSYRFRLTVKDNLNATAYDEVIVNVLPQSNSSQQLLSFTLINADTDQDIMTITNGAELNLATLPTSHLNVRSNTNPALVGCVVFSLNGIIKTENTAPYSLKGDNNGDYTAWTPSLGSYTLTGTPYSSANAKGNVGSSLTVNFTVTNHANAPMMKVRSEIIEMNAYPNPFSESVNIEFRTNITEYVRLEITNEKGNVVEVLFEGTASADLLHIYSFSGHRFKGGVYYSRLVTETQVKTQRLLMIK